MLTQSCIILAIVIYLCGMLYIGIAFSKKNSNTDDFYLGGRTLGPFVTAPTPRPAFPPAANCSARSSA